MKITAVFLTALLLTAAVPPASLLAASLPLRIVVNGDKVDVMDAEPFTDNNGRAQVPLRFVSEALGAKVGWNNTSKTAAISMTSATISLIVGRTAYAFNGQNRTMDTAAMLKNKRTYVPIRFVSEALGATVNWDKRVNTVYIDTSGIDDKPTNPPGGQATEENIYGFTVYHNTGSKLLIEKGDNDPAHKEKALLALLIELDTIGADYDMQVNEVDAILRSKIDKKTVDAVMAYVKTKTAATIQKRLDLTMFEDSSYKIAVLSSPNEGISVTIYMK